MRGIWLVAAREFRERVTSRAYLIGTLLFPLLVIGAFAAPAFLMSDVSSRDRKVVVVDEAPEGVAEVFVAALTEGEDGEARFEATVRREPLAAIEDELKAKVLAEEIDGWIWLPPDLVATGEVAYRARNVSNFVEIGAIDSAATEAVRKRRLAEAGVSPDRAAELLAGVKVDAVRIARDGREGGGSEATFFLGFVISFVLYMIIVLYGSVIMLSALEEKTSRVVEVVLSSVRSWELMGGKILGVGAAALLQVAAWTVMALALVAQPAMVALALSLPEDAFETIRISPLAALGMLAFLLLGFLLYAAVFAAIGAAANTQQEAQQFSMIPTTVLVVPLIVGPAVAASPDGPVAIALGLLPFTSPLVMPSRLGAGDVAAWEVLASLALLVVATAAIVWAAGRIYRIGVLATGSRPGLREIARWVRSG